MSKDKYQSIFLCKMEVVVLIVRQIFSPIHTALKIANIMF